MTRIERLGDDAKPTGTFGNEGACVEKTLPNSRFLSLLRTRIRNHWRNENALRSTTVQIQRIYRFQKKLYGLFCGHPTYVSVPVRFISLWAGHPPPFDWNSWAQHKEGCNSVIDDSYRSLRMKKKPVQLHPLSMVLSVQIVAPIASL